MLQARAQQVNSIQNGVSLKMGNFKLWTLPFLLASTFQNPVYSIVIYWDLLFDIQLNLVTFLQIRGGSKRKVDGRDAVDPYI